MTGDTPRSKPGYVEVRAFFTLAPQVGETGRAEVHLSPDRGQRTLMMLANEAGLDPADVGLAMVNGRRRGMDFIAEEGDRIAFFPDYVPYHRAYGMCVL